MGVINVAENQNFQAVTQSVFACSVGTINLMQIGFPINTTPKYSQKYFSSDFMFVGSFFRSNKRASRLLSWSSQWSPRSTKNCSARADLNNCQTNEKQDSVNHHVRWGIEAEKIIKESAILVEIQKQPPNWLLDEIFLPFSPTWQATSIFVVAYTRIHVLWNFPSERRVGGKFMLKIRENPLNLWIFAWSLN